LKKAAKRISSSGSKKRKRELRISPGIDFTSNDYLGLTKNSAIRARVIESLAAGMPLGSGGSRLLRGNHFWHEQAEKDFVEFENAESALFFSSGYAANMAVLTAIPTRHDLILYDTMVHASIKEGIHASLAAKKSFTHNDVDSLRAAALNAKMLQIFLSLSKVFTPWMAMKRRLKNLLCYVVNLDFFSLLMRRTLPEFWREWQRTDRRKECSR